MIRRSVLTFIFITQLIFANDYSFDKALLSKKIYSELYDSVFEKVEFTSIREFKKIVNSLPKEKREEVIIMINELSDYIPSKLLRPIIYWSKINPNKINLNHAIEFAMIYKALILRDAIQSPISTKSEKSYALKLAEKIYHRKDLDSQNFYSKLSNDFKEKSHFISKFTETSSLISAIKETDAISFSVDSKIIRPYSVSFQGFIPGNKIKLISRNGNSEKRIKWFHENYLEKAMPSTPTSKGHISFRKDPIFIKYRELIDEAQSSILINTPLLGGSIGNTITDYLIKKSLIQKKINPDFKIIIHHPFQMRSKFSKEVGTLLINLKKKIRNNPILKENLFLVNSDLQESDFVKRLNNIRAIVVDGNSSSPQAYIGSKTLSDNAGGYNYDNMLWIKGPAAAHIQETLFEDIKVSLKDHISKEKLQKTFAINRKVFPHAGTQLVRLSENNTQTNIKNIRNMVIDMIVHAKKSIYMEQRFIYDSYVNDALIKKKLEIPSIDIKILIDSNEGLSMNGLPNTIFIRELKMYGINIRARKTHSLKLNSSKTSFFILRQNNNRKIISVDEKILHIGSADLNPKSLQGTQRDLGVQIFDKKQISHFNKDFRVSWSDKEKSLVLDIENFEATIEGDTLSKEFSSLINSISKAFLKVKGELEASF